MRAIYGGKVYEIPEEWFVDACVGGLTVQQAVAEWARQLVVALPELEAAR